MSGFTATTERVTRARALMVLLLLGGSLACLVAAPRAVDDSYSWVEHSVSASAGQGVDGAWVARLGFLLYGFAVLGLASTRRPAWGLTGQALFALFGVMMLATAAFSHAPWQEGVPYDRTEDDLHTVTASVMGFAFVAGALVVMARLGSPLRAAHAVDGGVAASALVLSLLMGVFPGQEGLVQRVMFLMAYAWFAREATLAGWSHHDRRGVLPASP